METYIVNMDVDEERAEEAANLLTGEVFPGGKFPALLDQIGDFLRNWDFPPGMAVSADRVTDFRNQCTVSDNWPSRECNCFVAVVFVEDPLSVGKWMEAYRKPHFRNQIGNDEKEEIFRTVLPPDAISYELLQSLWTAHGAPEPEDLILLRNHTDVPGFDDLSYLLKDKDNIQENYEVYVEELTAKELSWLYEHNRDSVNRWLADQQVDLGELSKEHDDVCQAVTVTWANATMNTYFQMCGYRNGCGPDRPVVI